MIRDEIKAAQTAAMKGGDKERLAAVRLILAKIKDRDIELRTASQVPEDDALVTDVLQKMVKQRRESIAMYEQGGRAELAAKEQAELDVIEGFLPTQMSEDETRAAIEAIKSEVGASSRSEEHTSELQSLMRNSYAVFCLKKKTQTHNTTNNKTHTH